MDLELLGYFCLWRDPDGLSQVAKVIRDSREVFWDMAHLYFAFYSAPKKPPYDFWHTRASELFRLADSLGYDREAVRVQLGFQSRCIALAMLTFMTLVVSGRTISEALGGPRPQRLEQHLVVLPGDEFLRSC